MRRMRAGLAAAKRSHLAVGQESSVNGHGKEHWLEVFFLQLLLEVCVI